MYKRVFTDQCGYLPEMKKEATFQANRPVKYSVCKSDGTVVYQGEATEMYQNAAAKEKDFIGDFSKVTECGKYFIQAEGLGESDTFEIGSHVYDKLFQAAMKFFYLQRCGCDLPKEAAGMFAHKACHTSLAEELEEPGKKTEAKGGWHDAGDFGRYIVPGAMAVVQLLLAYENNMEFTGQYENRYDETKQNGLPDYLSEIRYELDWMLKLQKEDGTVYHKLTCKGFCGFVFPDEERDALWFSPVSVTATADFAAALAMASRFYRSYDAGYADKLLKAAEKAYAALQHMELPGGFKNPQGVVTGEYDDACDEDERYWASAELYKTTGKESYRIDFENRAKKKIYHGYGWRDMGSYGNRAYLSTEYPVDKELKERIKKEIISLAEERLQVVLADGYKTALRESEYAWGSNMDTALNGIHLLDAYRLTGEQKYREAAENQLHYLLGRNPMGVCYVTGFGSETVRHPHHRPSAFLGNAMPGMLSGGPCDWLADAITQQIFTKETAPAKSFADMTGSYSTNEVTIYWNSSLIQLLAEIMAE